MGLRIHSFIPREERESLLSTGRRLSWCDRTDAQGGVDSHWSSGFKVVVRRISYGSSYLQVLRMDSGSKGDSTENSVMGSDVVLIFIVVIDCPNLVICNNNWIYCLSSV
jgi:hypothetical protein